MDLPASPASAASQLASAFDLQRSGRPVEAERLYREILSTDPDNLDALHLLGMLAHQSGGREAEAERLMLRSIELAPRVPDFHNNYAGLLQKSGRFAEAIEHLRTAISLRAEYPEALANLAIAQESAGLAAPILQSRSRALRLKPGTAAC